MNMSTAYLIAGFGFAGASPWFGHLAFLVGSYYIVAYVASTILAGTGYWWYAFFVFLDLVLAGVLGLAGFGLMAKCAAVVLVTSACVSAYAGREGGFLYSYYPAIGGVLNTLFIFLMAWQVWASRSF